MFPLRQYVRAAGLQRRFGGWVSLDPCQVGVKTMSFLSHCHSARKRKDDISLPVEGFYIHRRLLFAPR